MNSGTGLNILQKAMPERYFDVGIAEQQAILFAAGLALQGSRPVAAIYSTFLQRAYDQIVHDVCLQKLPVVFAMDRAGLVGDDGPTHHGVFDIAYLRCLPNIVLMAPRDEAMLVHMLHTALQPRRRAGRRCATRAARRSACRCRRRRGCSRSAPARSCARASASRSSATAPASARRSRRPTCSPSAASTSPSPTRASPSRSTPALLAQLAAEHELLVTVEEGVLAGGFGTGVWEALSDGGARRRGSCASGCPTATSRTARRRCCTTEVGFTRRADRRAHRGGRARPARHARFGPAARHASQVPFARHGRASRLDTLLAERGLFTVALARGRGRDGRRGAPRRRGGGGPRSPGSWSPTTSSSTWRAPPPYVSRGGIKLANALDALRRRRRRPARARRRRLDRRLHRLPAAARRRARGRARRRLRRAGAGAARRRARDRARARRTRARWRADALPYAPDLVVADVSFISLTKVLPAVLACARGALRRAS